MPEPFLRFRPPPVLPPDRKALDEMARRAWRRDGIAILWPDRLGDPWERQLVRNLANALYGQRHE
jgi:hypothetical protein